MTARGYKSLPGRTHGKVSTYNQGCRCDLCKDANKASLREYRSRPVESHQHGTITGYVRGCRCYHCKDAKRAARRGEYVPPRRPVPAAETPEGVLPPLNPYEGLQVPKGWDPRWFDAAERAS